MTIQKLHKDAIELRDQIDHFVGVKEYKGGFIVPMISINYSGSENYEEQVELKDGVEILIFPEKSTQPYLNYDCIYEQSSITVYVTTWAEGLTDFINQVVTHIRNLGHNIRSLESRSMLDYNIAQRTILKLEI